MSDDRSTAQVRLTADQRELFRRRAVADQLTVQTVLSALVNAYILGDVRVSADGRYRLTTSAAAVDPSQSWPVPAPTATDPDRTLPLPAATRSRTRRQRKLSTPWLSEHLAARTGRSVDQRLLRRFLVHLEETGVVEPRTGHYWSFDGPDDPNVVAIAIALDDGTYSDWSAARLAEVQRKAGTGE